VASELSRQEMRKLASIGAARRLEELRQEQALILAAFPELGGNSAGPSARRRGRPGRRRASTTPAADAPARKRKRSYTMTAAQKKAVSERMKKYWAARRKAKD
jgi:hypothetical protein